MGLGLIIPSLFFLFSYFSLVLFSSHGPLRLIPVVFLSWRCPFPVVLLPLARNTPSTFLLLSPLGLPLTLLLELPTPRQRIEQPGATDEAHDPSPSFFSLPWCLLPPASRYPSTITRYPLLSAAMATTTRHRVSFSATSTATMVVEPPKQRAPPVSEEGKDMPPQVGCKSMRRV